MRVTGETLILVFLFSLSLSAQLNPGARQISVCHSDAAVSDDVFALFNNPAGLARISVREFGFYYSPAPFGFKELSNGFAGYCEPFSFGTAAAGAMSYGYDLYKETKILLSLSYRIDENIYAGITGIYNSLSIKNYGKDQAFHFDIGGLIILMENLSWGFCLHNVNRASFGNEEGQIPEVINTGFSFKPLLNLSINFALEKDLMHHPSLRWGIDYRLLEYIALRSGFGTEPDQYAAGIGIFYSLLNLDYAFFTHPVLGLTHQAGLIITFNKNE